MNKFILGILISSLFIGGCAVTKFAGYYISSDDEKSGTLNGDVYTTEGTSYKIGSLPGSWQKQNVDGGDLVFQNSVLNATISVNSDCDGKKVKHHLTVLSDSLLIGISGKELVSREESMIDGQQALYSIYTGSYENVPLKLSTLVFKKAECIYDFTYASSPDNFDAGYTDFKAFTSGFRVL